MPNKPLSINGLVTPADFPATIFESIHKSASSRAHKQTEIYTQFASAWNAVGYRFVALTEYEQELNASLANRSRGHDPIERNRQERQLFGFFNSGFSVYEATFYGLFCLGAFIQPSAFPTQTPKDQQRISPTTTASGLAKSFPDDPINLIIVSLFADSAYIELREIRNILTHRAAPGRTFHLGIGDEELPETWKLKNIQLDAETASLRRKELSRVITVFMEGINIFAQTHL